jgi:hypothetical protein
MKIINDAPGTNPNLSEQYVVSCNPYGYGCGGGAHNLGNWVMQDGIPDESCFPYLGQDRPCNERCADWQQRVANIGGKIIDWGETSLDTDDIKTSVMNGPTALAVDWKKAADEGIREDFFYYKSGVYEPIMGRWTKSGHGICLCGWSSSGNWLIKNSWGTWWGTGGYGYISKEIWNNTWMVAQPTTIPYMNVEQMGVENDDNGDRVLDAGENADILITLRNIGLDATGVTATLIVGGTGVTVTDNSGSFGDILTNGSATNTADPFHVQASAGAPRGARPATLSITGNGGAYTEDRDIEIWVGQTRMHYANIVTTNATLTTTDNSAIGFDAGNGNGSGFIYPGGGSNTLYYASMAFGNSSTYLVDNWFVSGTQDEDWKPTNSPDGRLIWQSPPDMGDTMLVGQYSDSGFSAPKSVICEHAAWGFLTPNYDDFVILRYTYTNRGTSTINDLYSGIFCDFDIPDAQQNHSDIDESRYLAWVYNDAGVYVGITLLSPLSLLSNASSINNKTYVHPDTGMRDANQFKFMTGELHFGTQFANDYSAMVSAGPFDLAPAASKILAFAIVGGTTEDEVKAHSDSARAAYKSFGVEDTPTGISRSPALKVVPSPVLNTATITFSLSRTSEIEIAVYDLTGRLVQRLKRGRSSAGVHELKWNVSGLDKMQTGVFFVKLKTSDTTLIRKVVVLQ